MQNETLKIIHNRRSIRKYKADPISDESIQAIVDAAVYAPSAMNLQNWHFSVVQNQAVLAKMREAQKAGMKASGEQFLIDRANDPNFVPYFAAPTVIIVSGKKGERSATINCGLAAENIVLAAESLNIGTCIMTSSVMTFSGPAGEVLAREVGIPEGYEHVCAIPLGYKDEAPEAKERLSGTVNYIK